VILVDTNVLIDVLHDDPVWADWSAGQLSAFMDTDGLGINPVVYAELAPLFDSPDALDGALNTLGVAVVDMSGAVLFLAGKAHQAYRRRGGNRASVLSDFFIGAQATILKVPLLTRDARRYRRDFPTLTLITPAISAGAGL
jgi:predicted nucleic acid-binding protein